MKSKPVLVGRSRRTRVFAVLAAACTGLLSTALLSGFHIGVHEIQPESGTTTSELVTPEIIGIRTFTTPTDIRVTEDVVYGTRADGTLLTLDVCAPAEAGIERPAVLSIHGGSWARGDKANADWRAVCQWLASEGFVAYSLNYRLVPESLFPAAIDDVELAARWVRAPANAERFGIDPARLGAFGGSAGGNLAALLGTRGTGPLDRGSRVAAVAELSAPIDLRRAAVVRDGGNALVQDIISRYLGCAEWALCPQAEDASPSTFIDPSDPPFLIGHADAEFIPLAQSQNFAAALAAAGVGAELVTAPGDDHSIGILDAAMRERVAAFFHDALGAAAPQRAALSREAGPGI
ncbi:alpha/beta hydrolase [Microterricola pindariensis]|uniref:BD-FAE-like domain-containing protein n=1 Tax=Microterricola pindariensis TaxID=478010 RepID=A0ABX5AXE6_9MICO|nr:alpha/beta hydrolase [Microterricola pindariensis]PPL19059.1 hypothetical protein GY24_07845 [Microterricola pindariensis]